MRGKTFRVMYGDRVRLGPAHMSENCATIWLERGGDMKRPYVVVSSSQCRAIGERLIAIADAAKRGGDDAG